MTHPFRVGLQLAKALPNTTWAETAQRVEAAGFSTLFMPDHFGDQLSPNVALAVAAQATTDLRIGTLVQGNDYRHPVMLAKEIATLDVLSGGRVELGMGAGWMRSDYEEAGLEYDRPGVRIARLIESIAIVEALLGEDPVNFDGAHYQISGLNGLPKPVQSPIPLIIGGGGRRMLGVAARHADIVAVTANLRAGEVSPDAITDSMPEAYDRKIEWIHEAAGERLDEIELSSLTMVTMVTDDRPGTLEGVAAMFGSEPDVVALSPAALIGSVEEIAECLEQRRDRWGFNYPVLQGEDLDAFASIIDRIGGR